MQKKIKKRSVIFYTNSPVYFTVFPFRSTLSAMQMILMGTGTSHGIPVIGCECKVCTSRDKKDKRFRCSAYITSGDVSDNKLKHIFAKGSKSLNDGDENRMQSPHTDIVIDTGPEFRILALKYKIRRLDAVLLTHSHADHLHGLDDLRIFSFTKPKECQADKDALSKRASACGNPELVSSGMGDTTGTSQVSNPYYNPDMEPLPIYANSNTIADVKNRFDYVFHEVKQGGGKPKLDMRDCAPFTPEHPLVIHTVRILPVPLLHGTLNDSGWLISEVQADGNRHSIAYLTDCSYVPDDSIKLILEQAGILDHLVIDGLRVKPHSTHFSFDEALTCAEKLGAKHTWLTHICHDKSHRDIEKYVKEQLHLYPVLESIVQQGGSVGPAWDGLVLTVVKNKY